MKIVATAFIGLVGSTAAAEATSKKNIGRGLRKLAGIQRFSGCIEQLPEPLELIASRDLPRVPGDPGSSNASAGQSFVIPEDICIVGLGHPEEALPPLPDDTTQIVQLLEEVNNNQVVRFYDSGKLRNGYVETGGIDISAGAFITVSGQLTSETGIPDQLDGGLVNTATVYCLKDGGTGVTPRISEGSSTDTFDGAGEVGGIAYYYREGCCNGCTK